jgi:hypothetical protein
VKQRSQELLSTPFLGTRFVSQMLLAAAMAAVAACSDASSTGSEKPGIGPPVVNSPTSGLLQARVPASATAASKFEHIDVSNPMSIKSLPFASCILHPDGASDDRSDSLSADAEGIVRFYPPPAAWGNLLRLDCQTNGKRESYAVNLNDESSFFREPELTASPHLSGVQPALTEDVLAISQSELTRRGYMPRPDPVASPEHYQQWLDIVTKPHGIVDAKLVAAPGRHGSTWVGVTDYSNSWSGQILDSSGFTIDTNNTVTPPSSTAVAKAPPSGELYLAYEAELAAPHSTCQTNIYCAGDFWAGIGGTTGGVLIQSGFWMNATGGVYANVEIAPAPVLFIAPLLELPAPSSGDLTITANSGSINSGDYFRSGDIFVISGWAANSSCAEVVGNPGYACFVFYDVTSGYQTPTMIVQNTYTNQGFQGGTAEVIMERPNSNQELPNFGTVSSYWQLAWDTSGNEHSDYTDPWIFEDLVNPTGSQLDAVYFPSGPDYDTAYQFNVMWLGYQ